MNEPENQKFIGGLDSIIPGALRFSHARDEDDIRNFYFA